MAYPTLQIEKKKYVLVPEREFKRLTDHSEPMPPLPRKNKDGTYPALAAARATIAQTIIRKRKGIGLSQKDLAEAAGIRVETLNRIEKGRVTPDLSTITKIDAVLDK